MLKNVIVCNESIFVIILETIELKLYQYDNV